MKPNHNQSLSPELKEKLSRIRHLALDMDGTIYMGTTLFPFTIGFLAEMKAVVFKIFLHAGRELAVCIQSLFHDSQFTLFPKEGISPLCLDSAG